MNITVIPVLVALIGLILLGMMLAFLFAYGEGISP